MHVFTKRVAKFQPITYIRSPKGLPERGQEKYKILRQNGLKTISLSLHKNNLTILQHL
jgi:hypothetical protein